MADRPGIPMLFYMVIIDPLLNHVLSRFYGYQGSLGEYLSHCVRNYHCLGLGPLWFVAALLIFSLVYVLWRLLSRSPATPPPSEGRAPNNLAIAIFALALGLLTFVVRIWMPVGREFELLGFQFAHFARYIALFVVGIIAYRRNWFSALSIAQAKVWLWVALALIVLFPVPFLVAGALEGEVDKAMGTIHWPAIILLALALQSISLNLGLKLVLVAPLAVALSFLVGYVVKQLPLARDIVWRQMRGERAVKRPTQTDLLRNAPISDPCDCTLPRLERLEVFPECCFRTSIFARPAVHLLIPSPPFLLQAPVDLPSQV